MRRESALDPMTRVDCAAADVALVFPPVFSNDFRGPYLTLPHLLGFLCSRGVEGVRIHDVNVAFWARVLTPGALTAELRDTEEDLRRTVDGERVKELLYRRFVLEYLLEDPRRLRSDQRAVRLYTGILFERYYRHIEKTVSHHIRAIAGGSGLPVLDEVLDEAVRGLPDRTRLIAITVPTADQFYSALALAKRAKQRYGDAVHIALGGGIFALMGQDQRAETLRSGVVDSIGIHEGEVTLLGLCEHIDGKNRLEAVPNLVRWVDGRILAPRIEQAVPLDECPPPLFPDDLLRGYGPDVVLPVWATRGCYWGKCAFCDYVHLSANRNRAEIARVATCIDVIERLIARHGTRNFEMIAECLSPSFCRRFAEGLQARGLEITWTTHLRVEKQFKGELCRKIFASGCRRVTVGVESFNDRQLRVMKKGYTRADVVQMLAGLAEAGIEALINIIVDFPTVIAEEARETLEFLHEYRWLYNDVNVFPFVLSRLTEIARNPERFGIEIRPTAAKDHNRGFHFVEFTRTEGLSGAEERETIAAYQRLGQSHRRRLAGERSLEAVANHPPERVIVRPQPRFVAVRGDRARAVARAVDLDLREGDEALVFDLETKALHHCPGPMIDLVGALPVEGLPADQLTEWVAGSGTAGDGAKFAADVIRFGIQLGLLEASVIGHAPGSDGALAVVAHGAGS